MLTGTMQCLLGVDQLSHNQVTIVNMKVAKLSQTNFYYSHNKTSKSQKHLELPFYPDFTFV